MTKLNIGFIGLGNMGGPMAANLIKAGHNVTAFDLNQSVLNELASKGAHVAEDAKACATNADILISMLPAGKHVKSLYLGNNDDSGLINVLNKNTLVIDCSTIDAESARVVGSALGEQGISFVDAPVSGGVAGAAAGTLTFIVGGEQTAFEKAHAVLVDMGKNIFHAGDIGAGQVAKISPAWNMFLPISTNTACAFSNAVCSPPTIKVNVPAAAPATPPDTGASTKLMPCSPSALPTTRADSASIVEQSITKVFLLSTLIKPLSSLLPK
jgi:3-hydroxyisobutyrate dehydrogenase-like beta-hydroxyacid dehydrogenase